MPATATFKHFLHACFYFTSSNSWVDWEFTPWRVRSSWQCR